MNLKKVFILLVLALSVTACDKKGAQAGQDATKEAAQKEEAAQAPAEEAKPAPAEGENGGPPVPFLVSGDIAVVNGKPVTADRFNEQQVPLAQIAQQFPAEQFDRIKNDIVSKLIDDELIRQRVADRLEKVTADDVAAERKKFIAQFPSEEAYKHMMESMKMSEESLDEQLKISVALRQLLQDEYDAKVTDEEVKKFYDDNKDSFTHKAQVHARHILLKLDKDAPAADVKKALAKAKEIEKEAKAKGADFAELAKKYSEGPTQSNGGDLGFFDAERMVPEFSKAAFALKPGQVSDPVRTQFGYHIIKVEEAKPAGEEPFDSVKDQIRERLELQKLGAKVQQLLTELKSKATIERKDGDNIKLNPAFEKAREEASKNQGLPQGLPIGGGAPGGAAPAPADGDLKLQLNQK